MTEKNIRNIALLGSTGSIGVQALEVIAAHPDGFQVEVLTAQNNADLLIQQALTHKPNVVVIGNDALYHTVFDALDKFNIKVFAGKNAIAQVVEMDTVDTVLTAIVGFAGLKPTISAINANKPIALANKETLVVAGRLVTSLAKEKGVNIYPVDSEHSAIFQCIAGEHENTIEKIMLTASGGPFRGKTINELSTITKAEALRHPNWNMGNKITIDSATLMNKGLEVIEAYWLFGVKANQIEVVVHPQSIIHSMVQFCDGAIKAQMGLPDMKLPIQYALSYPSRLHNNFMRFSFTDYPQLTFEKPDTKIFRNLALAYEALQKGGNMPCVLNAANEVVVNVFLNEGVQFLQMPDVIEKCLQNISFIQQPNLEDLMNTDKETRIMATELISKI